MRRALMAVVIGIMFAPSIAAHKGHDHKVMGTVAAIHENHLEVKAADGKESAITLNEKTTILRDKAKLTAADIKVGNRVVVVATETKDKDGKTTLVAKEVRLGTAAASARK